jgi:hypothetical protein
MGLHSSQKLLPTKTVRRDCGSRADMDLKKRMSIQGEILR